MRKNDLRPILKKHIWFVPIFSFLIVLISPIIIFYYVIRENFDDIMNAYKEIFCGLFLRFDKDK